MARSKIYFTDDEKKKAHLKANYKYMKKSSTAFTFRFMNDAHADIISWLKEQPSQRAYLISLIREDIKEKGGR